MFFFAGVAEQAPLNTFRDLLLKQPLIGARAAFQLISGLNS